MTKFNPNWHYSLLVPTAAVETVIHAGLGPYEASVFSSTSAVRDKDAATANCYTFENVLDGTVVRNVGVLLWAPGKKFFSAFTDASARDEAALLAGAFALKDLRKLRGYAKPAKSRFKTLGYTSYVTVARRLSDDEAAEWFARRAVDDALSSTDIRAITADLARSQPPVRGW